MIIYGHEMTESTWLQLPGEEEEEGECKCQCRFYEKNFKQAEADASYSYLSVKNMKYEEYMGAC